MDDKDYNTGCPNGCGLYFAAGVGQDGDKCPTIGCDGILEPEECMGCGICKDAEDNLTGVDCGFRPLSHTDPATLKFGDLKSGRSIQYSDTPLFPKPDKEKILAEIAKKA